MKPAILPALAIVVLSSAAQAQVMPAKRGPGPDIFSAGVTYSKVKDFAATGTDINGVTLAVRAAVTPEFFLAAGYSDIGGNTLAAKSAYSIGFGTKLAAGNGSVELAYAYSPFDLNSVTLQQHRLRAAYTLDLGSGFDVSIALTEIINRETGYKNVTAPEVAFGYKIGRGFGATLAFATEDTLLGVAKASSTVSFGLRFGF